MHKTSGSLGLGHLPPDTGTGFKILSVAQIARGEQASALGHTVQSLEMSTIPTVIPLALGVVPAPPVLGGDL